MIYCLNCGKECGTLLCEDCGKTVDIEKLCMEISRYDPDICENELWNRIAAELQNKRNFKNVSFALAAYIPSPRREYVRLKCLLGGIYLGTRSHGWLFENASKMLESDALSPAEKEIVRGVLLYAYSAAHEYEKAENIANEIGVPTQDTTAVHLAEYLIKTRRYDKAEDIIGKAIMESTSDEITEKLKKLIENIAYRRNGHDYLPASKENKETYIAFINSLGFAAEMPVYKKDSVPEKMTKAEYPEFTIERNAGFRSFVAYDVETTGLSSDKDEIIEIGAVRVKDGEITEQFQMFVKPYKKGISERVTELTGITKDMVQSAPMMWDAFNAFADFIGEDIVIGYNNTAFDNKFLMRAGRYARRTLSNRFFDVKPYAKENSGSLGCEGLSLGELSQYLNITNPRAHRALADAETTARVYLALLERFGGGQSHSALDEQLDEEWV